MSAWNDFVKKIYWENHKKNSNYSFKDALKEASKRKSEMGTASGMGKSKKMNKSKANKSKAKKGGKRRGTRKNKRR
jgi:hypothetical protein